MLSTFWICSLLFQLHNIGVTCYVTPFFPLIDSKNYFLFVSLLYPHSLLLQDKRGDGRIFFSKNKRYEVYKYFFYKELEYLLIDFLN